MVMRRWVIGVALGAVALARPLRPVRRLVVVGTSMAPTLEPGDRLLVVRVRRVRVGQLVAFGDPCGSGRRLVKRVAGRDTGSVDVVGDNAKASTDSRHFGPVPRRLILGRPIYRYLPEYRRGRL